MAMIVVPGSSNRSFAYRLSQALGAEYVETEIDRFPDGETHVRIPKIDEKAIVVQSLHHRANEYLMEFLIICDALRGKGCKHLRGVIPYMAYARQDAAFTKGEAISMLAIANVIETVCDEVITVDMHLHRYKAIGDVFRHGVNVSAMGALGEYVKRTLKKPVVVGPDEESEQWAQQIAGVIGCPYDVLTKRRISPDEVQIAPKTLQIEGRDVVIGDDIISTGGTMAQAVEIVNGYKPRRVVAVCTHALLVGDALTKIMRAGASEVIGTDTVPGEISKVSVVPAVAKALR